MGNINIVNCFCDSSSSGFGDFLRGSIHLYEICKFYKLGFNMDTQNHKIDKFLSSKSNHNYKKSDIVFMGEKNKKSNYFDTYKKELHKLLINTKNNEIKYINSCYSFICSLKSSEIINFLNKSPKLSDDCSGFFKENLNFSDEVRDEVKKELDNHELKNKKFNIIHFRLGDEKAFYKTKERFFTPKLQECFEICRKKSKTWKNPIVILSDSNELKTFIRDNAEREKIPLHVFHLESSHMQEHPSGCEESNSRVNVSRNGLFYTCFDMMLISLACRGLSYSVYDHGSGFFCWLCKIYNIPFKMQKFNSNEK